MRQYTNKQSSGNFSRCLIDQTGASSLAPALLEWLAELAAVVGDTNACEKLLDEAVQGYAEIGAPKQVERLVAWRQMRRK